MFQKDLQKAVLGSIIIVCMSNKNNEVVEELKDKISEYMFFGINRKIYSGIQRLFEKNILITNITLSEELNDSVPSYEIHELFLVQNEIPSPSFLKFYVKMLTDKFYENALKYSKTKEESQDIIAKMEKIDKQKIEFDEYDQALQDAYIQNVEGSNKTISFGYKFLDDKLGGIQEQELVTIGGITNTGKSTFASKIALNASKNGKRVVIVSLEEDCVKKARKDIFYFCNRERKIRKEPLLGIIDYLQNKAKFREEEQANAIKHLSNSIKYLKASSERVTLQDIKNIYKMKADLYIFDHLHYFGIDTSEDSKANAIEKAMQEIKNQTVMNKTRTVLIAHFTKLDESKRPTMNAFKDSISIPQTSDTIIMLWRDKKENEDVMKQYETEFIVPKNRIDQPAFTAKATFDVSTNDYVQETGFMYGTKNSDNIFEINNY